VALPDDLDAAVARGHDDLRPKFRHCAVYLHPILGLTWRGPDTCGIVLREMR